jgi:23S rRNA pseudouridine2457 synthase
MEGSFRYILLYKPYGVLSQFTARGTWKSLQEFGPFPSSVYPVGRLDADSEGLLLLTDDNAVKHRLADPSFGHPRTYLAQVENIPDENDLQELRNGVFLEGKRTKPAEAFLLINDPDLPPRSVPIRYRKSVPTSWISLTLREGRNRQVRKMTAAVGHPTLRLVRTMLIFLTFDGLTPGQHRYLTTDEVIRLKEVLGISRNRK